MSDREPSHLADPADPSTWTDEEWLAIVHEVDPRAVWTEAVPVVARMRDREPSMPYFHMHRSAVAARMLVGADDRLWLDLLAVLSRADLAGWPVIQGFRNTLEARYIKGPGYSAGAGREAQP